MHSNTMDDIIPPNLCTYVSPDNLDTASDIPSNEVSREPNCYTPSHKSDSQNYSPCASSSASLNPLNCKTDSNTTDNKIIKINRNPPPLSKEAWEEIDTEFTNLNKESWNKFRTRKEEPEDFIKDLNTTLAEFLQTKPEFQHETKEFFKKCDKKSDNIEDMRKKKNILNKKAKERDATDEDKQKACEAVRMYNYMSKLQKERDLTKIDQDQEKAYRKDFWTTARDVTNGTYGKQKSKPTLIKCTADLHYKDKYEKEVPIDLEGLSWFPQVEAPTTQYNLV